MMALAPNDVNFYGQALVHKPAPASAHGVQGDAVALGLRSPTRWQVGYSELGLAKFGGRGAVV